MRRLLSPLVVLTPQQKRPSPPRILVILALCWIVLPSFGDESGRPLIWGICGHPTWPDYADWVPGNLAKEMGYTRELGCTFYRCSFEGASYPAILRLLVPPAADEGITLLPILPLKMVSKDDSATNYATNYKIGQAWANYAISNHYDLPYWELGNELENGWLIKVVADGTTPDEFPDKVPGGFDAIASSLNGAYHGIKDAYSTARDAGSTSIVPKILYGCTYRHWGLLTKLLQANGSLPCDIISWHWYEPNYGSFNAPIHVGNSPSNNRTPAQCLSDFKNPDNQPMDVWITECNRSIHNSQGYIDGSFLDVASGQDWPAEARQIQTTVEDLKKASNVKAIFVYELLDDRISEGKGSIAQRSEASFGLVTGVNGERKDAFYAYQKEVKGSP